MLIEDKLDQGIRLALRDVEIRKREERRALKEKLRLALMDYIRTHDISPAGPTAAEIIREIDARIKSRAR